MGGKAVANFDLSIEVVEDGVYRAVVTAAPVGSGAATTFRLPSELVPPDESVLADATLSGEVGEAWRASITAAASRGQRLRIRMHDAPTDVPWELISAGPADTTVVRLVPSWARAPLRVDGPLRVLVACGPQGLRGTEMRWSALRTAVEPLVSSGALAVEWLDDRSPGALVRSLRGQEVHLLHIVDGDPGDRALPVMVADHDALRVVLLDRSGPSGWVGPAVTAQAVHLARSGCPGVAAMSAPTPVVDPYFRYFYLALVSGAAFDIAAACLATPVVVVGRPDARVFEAAENATATLPSATYSGTTPGPPKPAPPPPPPQAVLPVETPNTVRRERPTMRSGRGRGSLWRALREAAGEVMDGLASATTRRRTSAPHPRTQSAPADRTAYPRIDVQARRTGRRDVVLVDEPFDVVVGLGRYQDVALAQTGALRIAAASRTDFELVLTFDPTSLVAHSPTRLSLSVTDADPFPSQPVRFTARYRPDLPRVRRIGVHYLRDGQVVGIAWRSFVVVLDPADIAGAPVPPPEPNPLLDLEPLVGEDLPDLVLSVCASDGPATGEFVWTAYAESTAVVVPDGPRISRLDNEVQQFVAGMRNTVAYSTDRYAEYLTLVGKATKLGRAIPESVVTMVRGVVEDPARREAATVLLLTEELSLPWELSVFDPPLDTVFGGVSPFLGAHAAVSRWPLTSRRPRPSPRSRVTVRRAAVLTADYAGVVGVAALDHAQDEARQVAALFAPPAVTVPPSLPDVVGMFRGVPPAEILHVALHGRFDAAGSAEGLVLVSADTDGSPVRTALFLTPDQVETGRLDGGPFVFLNACQVASDKRVLGDYGGFASTLLRIGATGVVAPLWNVDDDVAAEFARSFYAATWTATGRDGTLAPTSVAEAVRALRAQYTEAAAEAHTDGVTATLIAFQVFGHPRLRLAHV